MNISINNLIFSILAVAVLLSLPVSAQYVELGESGWAMISTDDTVEVFMDDITAEDVTIRLSKTFTGSVDEYGFLNPIQIEFQKISESARSSIIIDSEMVVNETTHLWHDYHMQLMVDVFTPEAGFGQSIPHGGQLENVSFDQFYGFDGLPILLNFENGEGEGVSNLPIQNIFHPGLADGEIVIHTNAAAMEIGESFGFKQHPTVPEPATVVLFVLGVVPAIAKRNKEGDLAGRK